MNNESLLTPRMPPQARDTVSIAEINAVSWPAIIAGATGAAALSLILLILGTGLGLSSISPWVDQGASAGALATSTILWITLTQIAAAGMGGYLAGRLRTRWSDTHSDEVYFRDTAHGFLAWALATLVTAGVLTSAISGILGAGAKAGATLSAGAANATAAGQPFTLGGDRSTDAVNPNVYIVDRLFRREPGSPDTAAPIDGDQSLVVTQVKRMVANGLASETMPPDDLKYAAQLISQRTGLSQADAEKRVTGGFAQIQSRMKRAETSAREATDKARKASAYATLWLFVSLLVGAFSASLAATYGGRRRDLF